MIELDVSKVKFSKRDVTLGVKVPTELTPELAYETGVHIGDGHLTISPRKDQKGNNYMIVYSGNLEDEIEFYSDVILNLIKRLYNKECSIKREQKNTVSIRFRSMAVATFKSEVMGLPSGNKKGRIRIPKIIMDAPLDIKKFCLAGIVDTDFSLTFKREGKDPRITGSFPCECRHLVDDMQSILSDLEIKTSVFESTTIDSRYNPPKPYKHVGIGINGKKSLELWMNAVGFKSSKHLTKLQLWRRYGTCPPYTSLASRKFILAPKIMPQ